MISNGSIIVDFKDVPVTQTNMKYGITVKERLLRYLFEHDAPIILCKPLLGRVDSRYNWQIKYNSNSCNVSWKLKKDSI